MTNPYQSGSPINEPNYASAQAPLRHSGVGIASFIIAMLAGLIEFMAIAWSVVVARGGGMSREGTEILGFVACGGLFFALVGAGLGIGGLIMRGRKKLFAIMGVVLNGLILLGVGGLIVIGLMMKR